MKTINWVVAGVGDIARRRVIPAIQTERRSTLYGLVTRSAAKAEEYPGTKTWSTVEEAVRDNAVDAVYIALPVAMHVDAAAAALRAGKHVLCEKPMAMSDEEAGRMVTEARESGCIFGVSYYRRLYPKLLRARQLISEGIIGRPVLVEANCHSWLPSEDRGWLCDPVLAGGGPLYDIASHRIDAMNFLFGEPEQASGMMSNAVHGLKVEDSASMLIRYAGGIHGYVDVRWNSRISRDQFRIIGVEGELGLDSLNGPELRVAGRIEMLPTHANVHYPLILNFAGAIDANAPSQVACNGEQARWVDWVIGQVMHSAGRG
jgi:1,5-anhydro-D-fructose reductase (1,5-anhydro-D-mannitol-forming)